MIEVAVLFLLRVDGHAIRQNAGFDACENVNNLHEHAQGARSMIHEHEPELKEQRHTEHPQEGPCVTCSELKRVRVEKGVFERACELRCVRELASLGTPSYASYATHPSVHQYLNRMR